MLQPTESGTGFTNAYKFLVVDDSIFARRNLTKVIEAMGGDVVGEAANGREAVNKYFELKPDLVLMDVSMPEMEGLEALSLIRERDSGARVVIVSALGHAEIIKRGISLGAKHFIVKPFDSKKAASIIRFVLEGRGSDHAV